MWTKRYANYWKEKTQNKTDKPPDEAVFRLFFNRAIKEVKSNTNKILDLGCGFGRFFPVFFENKLEVYGIDISREMIIDALCAYGDKAKELKVDRLENVEYQDNSFDIVVAWAVFDAVEQEKSVKEILRVLKTGGVAIVTGKNDNYFADDKDAIIAEEKAKQKKHPNYFTDYNRMKSYIQSLGGALIREHFFPRRGDFGNNTYLIEQPARFYEWCILIKKVSDEGKTEKCSFSSSSSLVGNKVR